MEGAAELDKRLDAAVENYGSLLRSFAGALRSVGPEPSAEEQAALVARLDAAFAADRALQDVLAGIGALDARAAQVREARTECAMAEADVHSAVTEALADVRTAVDRANAARRRVARLSALAQLCASIPSSCESPDAEGASPAAATQSSVGRDTKRRTHWSRGRPTRRATSSQSGASPSIASRSASVSSGVHGCGSSGRAPSTRA